jgi:hypothetical protein
MILTMGDSVCWGQGLKEELKLDFLYANSQGLPFARVAHSGAVIGKRPEGCMGFALYRIDAQGKETALPSHTVFKGDTIHPGQTTEEFPVQMFYWKDPVARPIGEKTGNMTFRYKIVSLEGEPSALTPMKSLPMLPTNEVELTPVCSPSLSAVFKASISMRRGTSRRRS